MAFETVFGSLFEGNPEAHYTRQDGKYQAVEQGVTEEDTARHLRGEEPSLLSIPILPDGNCHFGALDVDRHADADEPVDHGALAQRVTELGLPLVVCRSKNPKSAHLWLFLKEKAGFPSSVVRRLLERYRRVLNIPGEVDIFPRQEELKEGQLGNGINLPYFGAERGAFSKLGEPLDLAGFITLAQERQAFGQLLANRDLTEESAASTRDELPSRPLPVNIIRDLHLKNLASLRAARAGTRNDTLNATCFFAAKAFAAGALEGTEQEVKDAIRKAAFASGMGEREVEATGASGWGKGILEPLKIFDIEQERGSALARSDVWVNNKDVPTPELEAAANDLALLTEEEYEVRRLTAAKRLKVRPGALDGFVARRRPRSEEEEAKVLQGSALVIDNADPWHEAVNGVSLLSELSSMFQKFVVFQHASDADIMALWSMATHCVDQFDILPYLGVTAPSKECGKTTALEIMLQFASRAYPCSNVTGAVIYRIIECWRPTLMVDELDGLFTDGEKNKDILSILNAGHKRAFAFVPRCVGEDQEVRNFNCFGPKAYGMIGKPPGTIFSRSIIITLLRKQPDERLEKFNLRWLPPETKEVFLRLKRQMARWAQDHLEPLQKTRPDTTGLANRAEDNWEPLLVIADLAGDEWPARARKAAAEPDIRDEEGELDILLQDIRNIFHTRKVERIPSSVLLSDLLRQEDSPWPHYGRSEKPLNLHAFGKLLGKLNVHAQVIRFGKQDTMFEDGLRRGYTLSQFNVLFSRQLAATEPEEVSVSSRESAY